MAASGMTAVKAARCFELYLHHIQAAGSEIQAQDAGQHEGAAEQGVYDVLHGRIFAAPGAPDGNQEIHRDDFNFPEQEEEQQVERGEYTQDAGLQQQQPGEIFPDSQMDFPGDQHHQETQDGHQEDQRQADAVHAQMIEGIDSRNPGDLFLELHRPGETLRAVENDKKIDGQSQRNKGKNGRHALDYPLGQTGYQRNQNRSDYRQKDYGTQ